MCVKRECQFSSHAIKHDLFQVKKHLFVQVMWHKKLANSCEARKTCFLFSPLFNFANCAISQQDNESAQNALKNTVFCLFKKAFFALNTKRKIKKYSKHWSINHARPLNATCFWRLFFFAKKSGKTS